MSPINRRTLLGLLGSTTLVGCTTPELVSRYDNDPFEGGIGGTGIVGVVTGKGSLLVNGLRVELTDKTRVTTAYGKTDAAALKPGMALTIFASRTRNNLIARDVVIDYALVGLARQAPEGGVMVNGVRVLPEPGVIGRPAIGDRLAISGAWSPQGVIASRIDAAPAGPDLIGGTVTRQGLDELSIGGRPVDMRELKPANGQYSVAFGQDREGAFEADNVQTGRFLTATGLRQLSVEGYLEPIDTAPGYRVAGLGHSFGRSLRLSALARRRAIYFGPYNGLFQAEAAYVVPENQQDRRRLLGRGYGAGFEGPVFVTRA